jgi:hypothetical protein
MRSLNGFSSLLSAGSGRHSVTCGRCGDSFSGGSAVAQGWLEAHTASEHQLRRPEPAPRASLGAPSAPAPTRVPATA